MKKSFPNKIYMSFCATTLNIVTVACSFHEFNLTLTSLYISDVFLLLILVFKTSEII